MKRSQAIGLVAAKAAFGAAMALGIALAPSGHANGPEEDQPGWSCVDDGNRVCGPGNAQGAPAGCYDDGGVLEFAWPCKPWTPDMGVRHGDGTTTFPNGDVQTDDGEFVHVGDHSHDISPAR